jgi:hypothetical protein
MAITFDGVTLVNPSPYTPDYQPQTKETILLSGKSSVQSSTELGYHVSYSCFTSTYSNVTDLRAKIGTKYSLVDDYGTRNAYISSFNVTKINSNPDFWRYEVSFIADTI